jgi:hypothetical protein
MKTAASELEAISAVDVDVVEPVGGGDEPLAVRAEAELVGIDDVAHDALALAGPRIERHQLVGHGGGDQQFLAVRRDRQMMRLAAEWQALELAARGAAENAVRGFFGIKDDHGVGTCRSRSRPGSASADNAQLFFEPNPNSL